MEFIELTKAKEIFCNYQGNHYQMKRSGEYEYYKKFEISQEIEYKWLQEIQTEIFNRLNQASNNKLKAEAFSEYGNIISQLKDISGFHFMLGYIKNNAELLDTNTLLRHINTILNTVEVFQDSSLKSNTVKEALTLLKSVLNKPIYISDDYKENGKLPDYLSIERVASNIKDTILYWETM